MSRPELPSDLRRFIVTNIPSVPYLEAILLLRAEPHKAWLVREMAARLYIAETDAEQLLDSATASGIADVHAGDSPAYTYRPQTEDTAAMLDRLAAHYAGDVVTVATLIHGRTDKRAQQFADAFRWRKDS